MMQHRATVDAVSPSRFDHRFIRKLADINDYSGPISVSEYDLLSKVFRRLGGSWIGVAKGSPEDVHKIKTIVKYALKHGQIKKKNEGQ